MRESCLMELIDDVIVLRSPTPDDAEEVAAAVQASLAELRPFLTWATSAYDADTARRWSAGEFDPGAHSFVVIGPGGKIIGSAGLNRVDEVNDRADIGYWIRSDATGCGYASRAANLLIDYAFDHAGLHRIEIFMSVENLASQRVAENTPARYEGVQRGRLKYHNRYHDAHIYALTTDDRPGAGGAN